MTPKVIPFRRSETNPYTEEQTRWLLERVESSGVKDEIWDLLPVNEDASRELTAWTFVFHLELAIVALEAIAKNAVNGGQPNDEPSADAVFGMRHLAALALCLIRQRKGAHAPEDAADTDASLRFMGP